MKLPRWKTMGGVHKRNIARFVFRRLHQIELELPLISFTFDDFPQSALDTGGAILEEFGYVGTFYVSLGCLGQDSPSGRLCSGDDVVRTIERGHELGCHTFSHCHSWNTESAIYEQSIVQNQTALTTLIPGCRFSSFAYPISEPSPSVKRVASRHFTGCREGGQKANIDAVDLHQLAAYFLEKSGNDLQAVKRIIDLNGERRGWLILATHDVADRHGPYGCTPAFFREVTKIALRSGSRILPIGRALHLLGAAPIADGEFQNMGGAATRLSRQ